jgi:hypothetical protein
MNLRTTCAISALLISFNVHAKTITLPYQENFENGSQGWTATSNGMGSEWQLGTPGYGITTGAYSGSSCWDINLNSAYENMAECYLISPEFDFTNLTTARVSFWTQYHIEHLWDFMLVQYTDDGGTTWNYLPFPELVSPDGTSSKWVKSSLDVSDIIGAPVIQFRFLFSSDATVTYDGISIDDFSIETMPLGMPVLNTQATTVYPNPGNGEFFIFGPDMQVGDFKVEVYDEKGQPVNFNFTSDPSSGTSKLTITKPSNGNYYLRMQHEAILERKKVVVMQ